MLLKGQIPTTEPIVSIGLVLPMDKQISVLVKCNHQNKEYNVEVLDNYLSVNGKEKKTLLLEQNSKDSSYCIGPITAGRGFHWQKKINITVKGLLKVTNIDNYLFVINEIGLESYLMSVATSEMSGDCPISLLEAQTISARSWIIASEEQKHKELDIDACNDDCCQRYQGIENISKEAESASIRTRGLFIINGDNICDARYSKSCGGMSENNENVWNTTPKTYLRGVYDGEINYRPNFSSNIGLINWFHKSPDCYCNNNYVNKNELKNYLGSVDEKGDYFRWKLTYSKNQLRNIVNDKLNEGFDSIHSLTALKRGVSGRITQLKISGKKNNKTYELDINSEYNIRNALHQEFLYSSAFIINANSGIISTMDKITLSGAGWGHGVGLCQIGALGMALSGKSTDEILLHYFLHTKIKKLYD